MSKGVLKRGGAVFVLCAVWYTLSAGSNVLNKLILQQFPFPLTLTASSVITASLTAIPLSRKLSNGNGKLPRHGRISARTYLLTIVPLAIGRLAAVSSGFFSLYKIPVSFAHTVKATMPLFSVFCARFVVGERQSPLVYFSLVPIVVGVVIASCSELSFSLLGLCSALFSTFAYALINSFIKKVMKDTGLHHIQLLGRIAQTSCLLIVPIWLMHDVLSYAKADIKPSWLTIASGVALSGVLNFLQNLCSFSLINRLSVLSYAVAGVTKRITIIVVSLLTLKNPVTVPNVCGMLMAVLGILGYSHINQVLQKRKALPFVYRVNGSRPLIALDAFPSDVNLTLSSARQSMNINAVPILLPS